MRFSVFIVATIASLLSGALVLNGAPARQMTPSGLHLTQGSTATVITAPPYEHPGDRWEPSPAPTLSAAPTPAPTAAPAPSSTPTATSTPASTATASPTPTAAPTPATTPSPSPSLPPTYLLPPPGYANLIFDDQFTGTALDSSKWNTYLASKGSNGWPWNSNGTGGSGGAPNGNNAAYFEPSQVSVDNGLALTAARGSSRSGYSWTSGVLSTYGKFQFQGGYVQIKAKNPPGNGMWPGLWMLPGAGCACNTDNFEIDQFEGGFLNGGTTPLYNYAWHLHMGGTQWGGEPSVGVNLSSEYHVYGLKWVPGQSITWYIDGQQVAQTTSTQSTIPAEPMELILSLYVGSSASSPWHQVYDPSTPTSLMSVAEVQVYQ